MTDYALESEVLDMLLEFVIYSHFILHFATFLKSSDIQ